MIVLYAGALGQRLILGALRNSQPSIDPAVCSYYIHRRHKASAPITASSTVINSQQMRTCHHNVAVGRIRALSALLLLVIAFVQLVHDRKEVYADARYASKTVLATTLLGHLLPVHNSN